jgi:hypothetical protein
MKTALFALFLLPAGAAATATPGNPLRDPFARPIPAAAAAPAAAAPDALPPAPLHLRAVILNGARSLANIDGEVVAAGDRTPGYTVLRIDARGVLVERAGRRQLLAISAAGEPAQDKEPE